MVRHGHYTLAHCICHFSVHFIALFQPAQKNKIYHSQGHNFCKIIIILSEIFTEIGSAYHWQWRLIIYIDVCGI